jgi:small neutral amino acid transporter SnatA (MarC family)
VGKKFISLLASSILKVYKGVAGDEGLAAALVTTKRAITTHTIATMAVCFLFMIFTSFRFSHHFSRILYKYIVSFYQFIMGMYI